jgi:hypothetical protein
MMSHYIQEVHAIKRFTQIIQKFYIMHLIIIQLQRQSPPVLGQFPSVKILAQSINFIGRPHNDTRINASNVSSFN